MDGNNGLLNEEFKTGKGIPFIALEGEGENEKFRLMDEAKAFLMQLKGPIAIAAIVGRYRTGKSLLVNRMLLDLAGNGFQVGSTVNSCTKGLWLWDKPLRCKNAEGQEVNLLIVDTEGIASLDADADHDAKIFALALLLSSFFIYNSVGSIDESALNNLSLVVELTKHIRTKAGNEGDETGAEFASFFPHFLWVVRDFTLQLVDENNVSFTPKQYLEKALTPMSGFSEGTEVKNRIRRMLLAFFPNRDCVTLKRPVEDEGKLQQLDTADWSEFRPEFVSQMKELRKKIYTGAPAKMLNGKMLDGFMLVHLAEAYSDSINTGSALNIGDAWGQVSLSRNKKAVEEGRHLYETKASALVKEMPFSKDELEAKHKELQAEALAEFKRCCIGTGADLDVFVHALMEELREELAKLQHKNAEVSRKKAEEEMEKVWAPLAAKVEAKGFGGYKEFETERLAIRKAFCDVTDGNPSQQEVLWAFMEKQIPPAAQAIDSHVALQTQTKLSEKEEEIKAAKNEGEQATIRAKAAEEELATRKSHAEEEKARFETQQKEMKDEVERARKELKERVEEEEKKRKEQVDALKKDLEEQVEKRDKQLKEEREKANSAQSELEKKVMLLEQKEKFTEEKVQSLAKDKESAQEQCRKLEGSVQDLNTKLLEAHKSAQEIGASAKEKVAEEEKKVEEQKKKVEEKEKLLEEVRGKLETERKAREEVEGGKKNLMEEEVKKTKEREELASKLQAVEKKLEEEEEAGRKAKAELEGKKKEVELTEGRVKELEEKLANKEKEAVELNEKVGKMGEEAMEAEKKATEAAEAAAKAAAEKAESDAKAAAAAASSSKSAADPDEINIMIERQQRMQEAFNEESTKLTNRVSELESECDRYKAVIHKLSEKIEQASAQGFLANGEDGGALGRFGQMMAGFSKPPENGGGAGAGGAAGAGGRALPPEMSSLSASSAGPRKQRQEIVFKPVQPDVFSQVAKQTNQKTEDVYRNHEAGVRSQGVAAAGVGSGEKFSFARLRQAISKKVTGAINKVDEWADNVEGVLLGPNGTAPPRPSEGGFYTATPASAASEEEREAAQRVLKNLGSPDSSKVAAGRAKLAEHREKKPDFDTAKGFSPAGAPTVQMQEK